MLLLLACNTPDVKDTPRDSADTDTDTDTDDTDDTGEPAEACPTLPAPDALSSTAWSASGPIPGGGILSFAAAAGGYPIYAGSHNTGVWVAADDTLGWERVRVNVSHTVADLVMRPGDPRELFRSAGGMIERTRNGGDDWETLSLDAITGGSLIEAAWALAVTPWDPDRVYAVVSSGKTAIATDDGDTFVAGGELPVAMPEHDHDDPFNNHAWRLLPELEEGGRVLFTDGHDVYVSDDGLQTWTSTLDAHLGGHSLQRDPLDPAHIVVAAEDGLYESRDEGDTWSLNPVGDDLSLAAWAEDGSWLALASGDTLYVSTDGVAFTARPFTAVDNEALVILANERLVMGNGEGVLVSDDRGVTWTGVTAGIEDPGMSVVVPHPTCPQKVFAASRCSGGLFVSSDYGDSWSHVDHYFHYVMALHFDPSNLQNVWAVSDDALLRSRDGGASWEQVQQAYHYHGFAVDPEDSDTLLLGSVGSGEWADSAAHVTRSTDGGETWTDVTDGIPSTDSSAHTLLHWPGDPDVVLLGFYKGGDTSHQTGTGIGLYRSTDRGVTWSHAELGQNDIAWLTEAPGGVVAATGDGLWRSVDEGVTWTKLAGPTGFLLSVDFVGDLGLTVSQRGELWRSDDGGDTWALFNTSLTWNPTTWLAQVGIAADASVAWVTVFDEGVWRIRLTP